MANNSARQCVVSYLFPINWIRGGRWGQRLEVVQRVEVGADRQRWGQSGAVGTEWEVGTERGVHDAHILLDF